MGHFFWFLSSCMGCVCTCMTVYVYLQYLWTDVKNTVHYLQTWRFFWIPEGHKNRTHICPNWQQHMNRQVWIMAILQHVYVRKSQLSKRWSFMNKCPGNMCAQLLQTLNIFWRLCETWKIGFTLIHSINDDGNTLLGIRSSLQQRSVIYSSSASHSISKPLVESILLQNPEYSFGTVKQQCREQSTLAAEGASPLPTPGRSILDGARLDVSWKGSGEDAKRR